MNHSSDFRIHNSLIKRERARSGITAKEAVSIRSASQIILAIDHGLGIPKSTGGLSGTTLKLARPKSWKQRNAWKRQIEEKAGARIKSFEEGRQSAQFMSLVLRTRDELMSDIRPILGS